jgi:triacylglycerol lipase
VPAFEPEATRFTAINALLLARLCNAAYSTKADAEAIVIEELKFASFRWISLTELFRNVYAIAASCDEFTVIAFRGTQNVKDWMTDVYATPVGYPWIFEAGPEVGSIHAGFGHALRDAWTKVATAVASMIPLPKRASGISTKPQPTLWLTGHSLGGALAVLAGATFSMWQKAKIRPVSGIYTFGQPRIGLYRFCGNYDRQLRDKTFRFVNKEDLVPRVPFRSWDYADIGQMIHFTSNGRPKLQSLEWSNFLSRAFESFKEFFSIATNIGPDVGDHSITEYERLVGTQKDALNALFNRT